MLNADMSGTKSAASKVLHFKALYQDMELERIKYFRGKHKAKDIEIKKKDGKKKYIEVPFCNNE